MALLVVWVGLYLLRLRPAGSGPLLKWGSLGLVLMLVGGGVGLAAQTGGTILYLTVPNWMFPTIQSALDAAPAGANVHIKPGVYHETLFVRKPLQIYGSEDDGGVVIQPRVLPDEGFASTDVVGLINYEDAGGGWLLHVRIDGGQAGLMGLGTADLVVDDLEVTGSRLGLLWDSGAMLTAKDLSIHGTVAEGFMNLKGHHAFEEFGLTFEGGIGM